MPAQSGSTPILQDTALYVALIMAAFAILFGTRHIDASEHHEGMVAAIAFESVVKLLAFLAVGMFVTYGVYDGFGDIFSRAAASGDLARLFTIDAAPATRSWISLTVLAMLRDRRAAAPVPGARGRERRRAARQQGHLAVSALSPAHQHLRAADRLRRPAAFPARAASTPTRSCWPCRWPSTSRRSRCSSSSAGCPRRPA